MPSLFHDPTHSIHFSIRVWRLKIIYNFLQANFDNKCLAAKCCLVRMGHFAWIFFFAGPHDKKKFKAWTALSFLKQIGKFWAQKEKMGWHAILWKSTRQHFLSVQLNNDDNEIFWMRNARIHIWPHFWKWIEETRRLTYFTACPTFLSGICDKKAHPSQKDCEIVKSNRLWISGNNEH